MKRLLMLLLVVAMLTMASTPYEEATTAEYKFKVGDQVLWGDWSCIISYAGPMTNLDGKVFNAYALQQLSGPKEFAIRYKGFVEKTAILEKESGSKESVPIKMNGEGPRRCDRLQPRCLDGD